MIHSNGDGGILKALYIVVLAYFVLKVFSSPTQYNSPVFGALCGLMYNISFFMQNIYFYRIMYIIFVYTKRPLATTA